MTTQSQNDSVTFSLNLVQKFIKRSFDIFFACTGLILTSWIIIISYVIASIDTGKNGFFSQDRVGKKGKLFKIIKIRTMREIPGITTCVTCEDDTRITAIGKFLRKTKIDELPQLINVLMGHMSIVGPRPDIPGFADNLSGIDGSILEIRPGITGPASLMFRNEEKILVEQENPEHYNDTVIYPQKVKLNVEYIKNYSCLKDLHYILLTLFSKNYE